MVRINQPVVPNLNIPSHSIKTDEVDSNWGIEVRQQEAPVPVDAVETKLDNRFAVGDVDDTPVANAVAAAGFPNALKNAPITGALLESRPEAAREVQNAVRSGVDYLNSGDENDLNKTVGYMNAAGSMVGMPGDGSIAAYVWQLINRQWAEESKANNDDASSTRDLMLGYSTQRTEATLSTLAAQRSRLERAGMRLDPGGMKALEGKEGGGGGEAGLTEHYLLKKDQIEGVRADLQNTEVAEAKDRANLELDVGEGSVNHLDQEQSQLDLLQALLEAQASRAEDEADRDRLRGERVVRHA